MKAKQKKEPNTELATRAANTMQIATERQAIILEIVENGGECSNEQLEAITETGLAIADKAEAFAHVLLKLETNSDYYKAVEEAARSRRKAIEKTQENMRKHLRNCMVVADMTTIKGDLFTFSVSKGRASANITNEGQLPSDLVNVVELIKPNAKAILERLQAGEVVPGATLEFSDSFLTIRKQGAKADE